MVRWRRRLSRGKGEDLDHREENAKRLLSEATDRAAEVQRELETLVAILKENDTGGYPEVGRAS